MQEPLEKRVMAFVDGQNLFHAAKRAFGYSFPNYDPLALARGLCAQQDCWTLIKVFFYTGIPSPQLDPRWHRFWAAKLAAMGKQKEFVQTFSRPLVYRNETAQEKGIDVRLALDVVRLAREHAFDVALIISQDQDLSEVAVEIRRIAASQNRWLKTACAYPLSPESPNKRGITNTDWMPINRSLYNQTIDPTDYR